MPDSSIDVKVRIRAYPYAAPSVTTEVEDAIRAAIEGVLGKRGGVEEDVWKRFSMGDILPEELIDIMDGVIGKLDSASSVLVVLMECIKFYVSSFGSFSKLLQSTLNMAQSELNKWISDLASSGLYMNVLIPPPFLIILEDNPEASLLSSGGFNRFLSSLQVSLNDTTDKKRPVFSENAVVGGLIIVVDAEGLEEFYSGIKNLQDNFSFLDLIPMNTDPSPPVNLRGVSGTFKDTQGIEKFGVKLTWDAPTIHPTHFRVYRNYIPNRYGWIREPSSNLVQFIKDLWAKKETGQYPQKRVRLYDDEDFNGGKPVTVFANLNGSGEYFDDFFSQDLSDGQIVDQKHKQYYYAVESGFGLIYGKKSSELDVPVMKCIPEGTAAIVKHKEGWEQLKSGWGGLGRWSSIRAKSVLPFLPALVGMMNKLLNSIKGMIKDVSDSVGDFIKGIRDKITKYLSFLDIIKALVDRIKQIFLGPSIAYLNLPPESGGIRNFLERIRDAEVPEDQGIKDQLTVIEKWTIQASKTGKENWIQIAETVSEGSLLGKVNLLNRYVDMVVAAVDDPTVTDPVEVGAMMAQDLLGEEKTRGFSGPDGHTLGIVFMYGASQTDPFGSSEELEIKTEAIKKTMALIYAFLTSGVVEKFEVGGFKTSKDWIEFLKGRIIGR
ncbi:MAG: hypothetical protein ACTSRU_13500 [Candidatus Hodarchaeales archaeon]